MTVQSALAAAAGLVALAFSMSTFERWLSHRHRHELVWSAALALFFLGAAFLWVGAADGWTRPVFRGFYLFGAIVNVPVLALGTIYLLAGQRQGDRWAVVIALGCAFAAGVVVAAPMRAIPHPHSPPQGSDVFGALPRVLAAVASGGGAAVVLGGAAWSAWRYRRGRMLWANMLIAGGTLILGASGLLNSVLGEMEGFAVTLAVGIAVIYAGFLVSATSAPRRARRSTLPTKPSGRASTKVTAVGHL